MREDKKVPILLSVIGAKTYALLRSLLTPTAPKDKEFKDIKAALESHFEPKPIRSAERYYFRRRLQAPGESIAEYVAELRRLSTNCKFDGYLEEELCDQLVCGVRVEGIRKKLMSEDDLTFTKALKLAQSYESADKNAQQLKGADPAAPVQKIGAQSPVRPTSKRGQACYRCGLSNHKADKCRFEDATCHGCGKKGHIKRACRSKKGGKQGSKPANWINNDQRSSIPDPYLIANFSCIRVEVKNVHVD